VGISAASFGHQLDQSAAAAPGLSDRPFGSPSSLAVGDLAEDVGLPRVPHGVTEDVSDRPAQRVVAVGLAPIESIARSLITASLSSQARR